MNKRFSFVYLLSLTLLSCSPIWAQSFDENAPSVAIGPPTVAKHDIIAVNKELLEPAVKRLLELQEEDGAWPYEGVYRVRGKIPVGYRIGGTAIACQALLTAPNQSSPATKRAVIRGVTLILNELEDPLMKPSKADAYDVRVWGHMYALDLFCQLDTLSGFEEIQAKTKPWLVKLVDALVTEELESGGWNYASRKRHAVFVTAPAVQALLRARSIGTEVPEEVFVRAGEALAASRNESGAFQYSGSVAAARNADLMPGSIARAPVGETTLLLLGKGDQKRVKTAIDAFHEHWQELEKRRKQTGTHKPPFGVAPYYFYYGHRYLAQAIQMLPVDDREKEFLRFEQVLLKTRDEDNTWNDRVFPRSKAFGTSMSILALSREHAAVPNSKPAISRE